MKKLVILNYALGENTNDQLQTLQELKDAVGEVLIRSTDEENGFSISGDSEAVFRVLYDVIVDQIEEVKEGIAVA